MKQSELKLMSIMSAAFSRLKMSPLSSEYPLRCRRRFYLPIWRQIQKRLFPHGTRA